MILKECLKSRCEIIFHLFTAKFGLSGLESVPRWNRAQCRNDIVNDGHWMDSRQVNIFSNTDYELFKEFYIIRYTQTLLYLSELEESLL